VVTRGADKSVSTMDDDASASLINERSTEVWWDPTGRRALFSVSVQGEETIRGVVADTALYFIVATPPRVEVLASPRLKAEAERVAGVVEKTGFAVVTVGPATKDRPATVIYAGPAHQEAAQRLAAALPGATVEKLTWKANGELVVTVGAK
jgi:LytR cell envelope-related transcriptional attenuator